MDKKPIYSIGHGSRKIEDFLSLLKYYGIAYLVDVRSQPFSRFHPQYNQSTLDMFLDKNNIKYVFMGDTLGGRPKDTSCYNTEGRVDYEVMRGKSFFVEGITRLKSAYDKNILLAIMCSERNPCECHRSKLVGKALAAYGIEVQHIDEKGLLKGQETVMKEMNKGRDVVDLFGNVINGTSNYPIGTRV